MNKEKVTAIVLSLSLPTVYTLAFLNMVGFPYYFALCSLIASVFAIAVNKYAKKHEMLFDIVIPALLVLPIFINYSSSFELINQIFHASENVNYYEYYYLSTSSTYYSTIIFSALFFGYLLASSIMSGSKFVIALSAILLCIFQMYFGLTPDSMIALILYELFFAAFIFDRCDMRYILSIISALVLGIVIMLTFPSKNTEIENYSEYIRDYLGNLEINIEEESHTAEYINQVKDENILDVIPSMPDIEIEDDTIPSYAPETEDVHEISLPVSTDYKSIILLLIITIFVIILPFVMIILVGQRLKKGRKMREAFDSPIDYTSAVKAIMPYLFKWVAVLYPETLSHYDSDENIKIVSSLTNESITECVNIWYGCVYGNKEASKAEYDLLMSMLTKTENAVWERLKFTSKLKARYISCLIRKEDEE